MFQPNDALLKQYASNFPERSLETLVDFGRVPHDVETRQDWLAEVSRFLAHLRSRNWQLQPAMFDGYTGLCPLYTVRLDRRDFQGSRPVELSYLQWAIKQFCFPSQTTVIHGQVLEIHVLGDS